MFYEAKVYKSLKGICIFVISYNENIDGIPSIYYFGIEGDYNVLVMDLLGANLEELFNFCRRKFSLRTCLMIAEQAVIAFSSCLA